VPVLLVTAVVLSQINYIHK